MMNIVMLWALWNAKGLACKISIDLITRSKYVLWDKFRFLKVEFWINSFTDLEIV
jgi:hypothetical protein